MVVLKVETLAQGGAASKAFRLAASKAALLERYRVFSKVVRWVDAMVEWLGLKSVAEMAVDWVE